MFFFNVECNENNFSMDFLSPVDFVGKHCRIQVRSRYYNLISDMRKFKFSLPISKKNTFFAHISCKYHIPVRHIPSLFSNILPPQVDLVESREKHFVISLPIVLPHSFFFFFWISEDWHSLICLTLLALLYLSRNVTVLLLYKALFIEHC